MIKSNIWLFVITIFISCKGNGDDPQNKKETYENGYYIGAFNSKSEREGLGTYYWNNGNKYVGYWFEGVRSGQGTFTWKDGTTITCQWINNRPTDEKSCLLWAAKFYYLFDDLVNLKLNVSNYANASEMLEYFRYIQDDESSVYINNSNQNGQLTYGFSILKDIESLYRVKIVYANSEAAILGVKRGWILSKINNETTTDNLLSSLLSDGSSVSKTFTFTDYLGNEKTINLTKSYQNIYQVHYSAVYSIPYKKVGYLAINNFWDYDKNAENQLNTIFSDFKSQNISELIIDARYSGSGYYTQAMKFANYVCSQTLDNKILYKTIHNASNSNLDSVYNLKRTNYSLSLNRIVFITSNNTGGLFELIINGLKPLTNVILIGDKTSGDPIGGNNYIANNTTIHLCTFKVANSVGNSSYYDGFTCDYTCTDGIDKDFGDVNEDCLKTALYYFTNNKFPLRNYSLSVLTSRLINGDINTMDRSIGVAECVAIKN